MNKNLKLFYLVLVGLALNFSSCKKGEDWLLGLNHFYVQMQKDGNPYLKQDWDSIRVFYLKNGKDTIDHISDYNLADYGKPFLFPASRSMDNQLDSMGVRMSAYMPVYAQQGINTFYFQQANGDIDTLYLEAKQVSNKVGSKDPCMCNNPITKILFNGKVPRPHPTLKTNGGQIIYLLDK